MTDGTFVALVDDKQIFTTNEDTWDAVKGTVEENQLHIECQNESFEGYVSWLVIGDRKDKHIIAADWTDEPWLFIIGFFCTGVQVISRKQWNLAVLNINGIIAWTKNLLTGF